MEKLTAADFIDQLELSPHPEGGYYKETYRSSNSYNNPEGFNGIRSFSTAIYYLLENNDFSAFHRIKSDELWHHYEGETLLVSVIHINGGFEQIKLGKNVSDGEVLQAMVPAGAWFASELKVKKGFGLVGCTVAPGFDFTDFEMANREELLHNYPSFKNVIIKLTR